MVCGALHFHIHFILSDLEQIPGLQLVPGVLQDVPQRQPQHRRVLNLLKVEQEGHLAVIKKLFSYSSSISSVLTNQSESPQTVSLTLLYVNALQIAYKVYVCSRRNLSYKRTCPINNPILNLNRTKFSPYVNPYMSYK